MSFLIVRKKMGWAYSYADRLGAKRVVLLAPSEWESKTVKVKDLRLADGDPLKELTIPVSEL